jgi:predicted transcriptional regulator of viral defense system
MMSRYDEVIALGVFTLEDAVKLVGSTAGAASLLQRHLKKGRVVRVRRGLYISIDPLGGQPTANKFQIASKIVPSGYVSRHSAFEYHGHYNQITYSVTVAAPTFFRAFSFDSIEYRAVHSVGSFGISKTPEGVAVTDIERTVLDGIDTFSRDMGLEELDECLSLVAAVNEKRLLDYLEKYDKQFLYQKAGFFLYPQKSKLFLSDNFFDECIRNIGASKRYLLKPVAGVKVSYDSRWHLVVPEYYARQRQRGTSDATVQ